MRIVHSPKKAAIYRKNFDFIANDTNRSNAAYHLQFIDHCWAIRNALFRTTRSLMNRTLLMELASIVEVALYDVLSSLEVSGKGIPGKTIYIPEHFSMDKLIDLGAYYGLVDDDLAHNLKTLNTMRNSIHFKHFHKKHILEYDYYTDDMVCQAIDIFQSFMTVLRNTLTLPNRVKVPFIFPWDGTQWAQSNNL